MAPIAPMKRQKARIRTGWALTPQAQGGLGSSSCLSASSANCGYNRRFRYEGFARRRDGAKEDKGLLSPGAGGLFGDDPQNLRVLCNRTKPQEFLFPRQEGSGLRSIPLTYFGWV